MKTATKSLSVAELSALYDRVYDTADKLLKKHNPCKIHTKDKKLCCTSHPKGHTTRLKRLCCGGCWEEYRVDHYSLFGCATKCLRCKLWLCSEAKKENEVLDYRLGVLEKFVTYNIPEVCYYQSKEQWLRQIRNRQRRLNYGR